MRLAKSQEEIDLMDTDDKVTEGTDSQASRFSGKDDKSSKYTGGTPQVADTPAPDTKKASMRRLRRGAKTPEDWEDEGDEAYYSAAEGRRTTDKKKKKRGPTNQIESDSARPRRGGARTPDRARNYSADASTPSRGTRSQRGSGKQSLKEKGSKKI